MGLLEPDGRRRDRLRPARLSPAIAERFVIIHSLGQARAALAAAAALDARVSLASAAGAAATVGPAWFKAVVALADGEFPGRLAGALLDCGGEAGLALAALRLGVRRIRFTGAAAVAGRLGEIAAALGAEVESAAPPAALDLLDAADPEAACRAFLARERDAACDR